MLQNLSPGDTRYFAQSLLPGKTADCATLVSRAEEVEQVEALLTTRNSSGELEGVKYAQISTVLVNAVNQ